MKHRIDWQSVDWHKYDAEIARELGCTREYVRQKRRVHGGGIKSNGHAFSGNRKPRPPSRWHGVDFSRPTDDIAKELGVSRTAVIQRRSDVKHGRAKPQ